ncbi:unnamed protein product [Parajaminaea phylloscopi]
METFTLHYWPEIPGRAEFIRLAFEYASRPYEETSSTVPDICETPGSPHFAVPVLQIDGPHTAKPVYLSQTPAILAYLAPILDLDGIDKTASHTAEELSLKRACTQQVLLTVLDLANEVHDSHHPVASSLYYEEQTAEAQRRATNLRSERLPKFLNHFKALLAAHGGLLVDAERITVADLALFIVLEGLAFALPSWVARTETTGLYTKVFDFQHRLAQMPRIQAYWNSKRRRPFGNGLFRHYPELDDKLS